MFNRIIVGILRLVSVEAYAQLNAPSSPPTIRKLVSSIFAFFSYISPAIGLFAFAMVVYGGYLWIVSGGEPQKKQRAQSTLTWSIAGLAFYYLIKMFLNWILSWI